MEHLLLIEVLAVKVILFLLLYPLYNFDSTYLQTYCLWQQLSQLRTSKFNRKSWNTIFTIHFLQFEFLVSICILPSPTPWVFDSGLPIFTIHVATLAVHSQTFFTMKYDQWAMFSLSTMACLLLTPPKDFVTCLLCLACMMFLGEFVSTATRLSGDRVTGASFRAWEGGWVVGNSCFGYEIGFAGIGVGSTVIGDSWASGKTSKWLVGVLMYFAVSVLSSTAIAFWYSATHDQKVVSSCPTRRISFSRSYSVSPPPRREAGDVWLMSPPVWNLRAVIWFHFIISCLVLLPSPVTLSVFFSASWSILLNFFQKILQYFSLRDMLFCMAPV